MLGATIQELRSVVRSKMEDEYVSEWEPIPDGEPLRMEIPAPLSLNPVSNVLSVQKLTRGKLATVSASAPLLVWRGQPFESILALLWPSINIECCFAGRHARSSDAKNFDPPP